MNKNTLKCAVVLTLATATGLLSGCANLEKNTGRGNIPGYYIRTEMQDADRAVEAARQAGKDKECPAEFKAAEDAKNKAYDVFRACFTEEGAALAKQATAMTKALCPPKAPAPAPTGSLSIIPGTVTKGQSAEMRWTSQNATACAIQPEVGPVETRGSRSFTPTESAAYTLTCSGPGGEATSKADIGVTLPPPPKPAPAPVVQKTPAAERFCDKPAVLAVEFDTNKADIKPIYRAELQKLAEFLKEFPSAKGEISGHTDNVGGKAFNTKLSQRRADSVKQYMEKNFGIAPERLTAKGFGFSKPVADNSTALGKSKNRRIEANFSCK